VYDISCLDNDDNEDSLIEDLPAALRPTFGLYF